MSTLTISNYDKAKNTVTVSREYKQGSVTTTLQHDIDLTIPAGKTYIGHEVKDECIFLTLKDDKTDKKTHRFYYSGLPATLTADFIDQYQAEQVAHKNATINIENAGLQANGAGMTMEVDKNDKKQLIMAAGDKKMTYKKEKDIEGLVYLNGLVIIYAGQPQSYEVMSNSTTLTNRHDELAHAGRRQLNLDFVLARKNFLQAIEDMGPDRYTADGYRVQDVLRSIDHYMTQTYARWGLGPQSRNADHFKKQLIEAYNSLDEMLLDPSKALAKIDVLKKSRQSGWSNVFTGALILLGAAAITGLAVAGMATLIPPIVMISVIFFMLGAFVAGLGGFQLGNATKHFTFNKDMERISKFAKDPAATHGPNKIVTMKDKCHARFPSFQPKDYVRPAHLDEQEQKKASATAAVPAATAGASG